MVEKKSFGNICLSIALNGVHDMPGVVMDGRFPPELSILHRPDIVARRRQFGHWECDLIQFRKKFGKANVTSLVERVSRFTVLLRTMIVNRGQS